jgi:hypothetical protein
MRAYLVDGNIDLSVSGFGHSMTIPKILYFKICPHGFRHRRRISFTFPHKISRTYDPARDGVIYSARQHLKTEIEHIFSANDNIRIDCLYNFCIVYLIRVCAKKLLFSWRD